MTSPRVHPNREQHLRSAAKMAASLEEEDLVEAIAGLIELSSSTGGGYGFKMVIDEGHAALEDRKHDGDYYLVGMSVEALSAILKAFG